MRQSLQTYVRNTMLGLCLALIAPHGDPEVFGQHTMGSLKADRILFLGNSLTFHGPKAEIGWHGNWGMGASAEDKDYVHLLTAAIDARSGGTLLLEPTPVAGHDSAENVLNIANILERGYATYQASKIQKQLDWKADIVILQCGENVPADRFDPDAFRKGLKSLLADLKESSNPHIFLTSHILWGNPGLDDIKRQICAEDPDHRIFVDLSSYQLDIPVNGPTGHPSDQGMKLIAETLQVAILRTANFAEPSKAHLRGAEEVIPNGPVEIGTAPQFLLDNYIVDNHWTLNQPVETVRRVFHPGEKHEGNPVIPEDGGYISVLKDEKTGRLRMWYQTYMGLPKPGREDWHEYVTSYAESKDGISWELPKFGLIEVNGSKENNVVWRGIDPKWYMGEAAYIVDVPEKDRRGYRYVMFYHDIHKLCLVGSHDGIHWDKSSVTKLTSIPSDSHNTIVYDPQRKLYSMYLRARPFYSPFDGKNINKGHSRRVARMASKELWADWGDLAENILIPDEEDADQGFTHFYGMPVRYYAGIYWGFLWPYKPETFLHTELAWSRDGIRFERLPSRPNLIERGPKGSWDYGMVTCSGSQWIEVGDQWWLYYCGNDGPHNTQTKAGIGLIKFRREGFVSLRGPAGGGFIATRRIVWPGGTLVVNADAHEGELRARVTDENRKALPGFDYTDCVPFRGDAVSHEVTWKEKSSDDLKGQVVRLEFSLRNADLYTFRASENASTPESKL